MEATQSFEGSRSGLARWMPPWIWPAVQGLKVSANAAEEEGRGGGRGETATRSWS